MEDIFAVNLPRSRATTDTSADIRSFDPGTDGNETQTRMRGHFREHTSCSFGGLGIELVPVTQSSPFGRLKRLRGQFTLFTCPNKTDFSRWQPGNELRC